MYPFPSHAQVHTQCTPFPLTYVGPWVTALSCEHPAAPWVDVVRLFAFSPLSADLPPLPLLLHLLPYFLPSSLSHSHHTLHLHVPR